MGTHQSQKNCQPTEPIAIIGISCRLPGNVHDLETFWQLLRNGVDAISDVPPDRFDTEMYLGFPPYTPGKVLTPQGGFLTDRLDYFEPAFFGISPREATTMDPQQRLLLETSWEAFEDAGLTQRQIAGSHTGVFIGMWTNEFENRIYQATNHLDLYATTGSGRYAASGRLSYIFDLQGPSLTIDTACSSSLVAVHLACQSLHQGETEMALVGTSNLILVPHISIAYTTSKMLAPDAHCKFGDAQANGYVRSEATGVLILKPLSLALANGDPIHALILSSVVNNDGHDSGLLVSPSQRRQATMLRKAYQKANISPNQVGYIEAHGSGTPAGDPVELQALGEVFSEGRSTDQPCVIGSVKTNIGHTEAAAGMAGLIKVVLCLKHRAIPPSLHFNKPNPEIPWGRLPFIIQQQYGPWPTYANPLIAGINAFGITGTNVHVILQEAPSQPKSTNARKPSKATSNITQDLFPISARSPEALTALANRYRNFLTNTDAKLADIRYTASIRRNHHEYRLIVTGNEKAQISKNLSDYILGEMSPGTVMGKSIGKQKVVFVFPGQGSQWLGMGRRILQKEPVFRDVIERCEQAFQPYTDWALREQLEADESNSRLDEIDVIQPILFAIEVALAELWRSWAVEPDAVVGHSMGEVAAAYIAGALSLEDAAQVICTRSNLMKRVSGKGAMAAVELTIEETQAVLANYEDRLSIAVSNGPRSTVISGDPDALQEVITQLQSQDIFCRTVKVDVAAHSPHMDILRPELEDALTNIQAQTPTIPLYATVTGELVDFPLDAAYWGQNLRQPVLFSSTVEQLSIDGHSIFIECSPHPILLSAIGQSIQTETHQTPRVAIPSMRRGENEQATLQIALATLYCNGYDLNWKGLITPGHCISLPTYPWQRERFWAKEAELGAPQSDHLLQRLLGKHIESAQPQNIHLWQNTLSPANLSYLSNHHIDDTVHLSTAAFVEMVFEAAADIFGNVPFNIETFHIQEALILQADHPIFLQLVLSLDDGQFQILSREVENSEWKLHAGGTLSKAPESPTPQNISSEETVKAREQNNNEHSLVKEIQLSTTPSPGDHIIHPEALEAAFQLLTTTLPPDASYLPAKLAHTQVFAQPPANADLRARVIHHPTSTEMTSSTLTLFNKDGQVFLQIDGIEMQPSYTEDVLKHYTFEIQWQPAQKLLPPANSASATGHWLISTDENTDFGDSLVSALTQEGASCVVVTTDEDIQKNFNQSYRGIIYARTSNKPDPATAEKHITGLQTIIQAIKKANWPQHLWVITRQAQPVIAEDIPTPALTTLWGLSATIAHEIPDLNCTRIDLDEQTDVTTLITELLSGQDDLVALRGKQFTQRFICQLNQLKVTSKAVTEQSTLAAGRPFRAETNQSGTLDGLGFRAIERTQPGPDEIEIEIHATGLNFMNMLAALGVSPGYPNGVGPLGSECSGIVSMLGVNVSNFQIGDEVVCIAFDSLGTHTIAQTALTKLKPAALTFAQAATIPVSFLTAYYALCHLGHIQRGERVLIHAATGGVGLAAIQLAQRIGAEIFATAGSKKKRDHLRSLGIQHVMDSRSLDFADQIMASTDGLGVDLVLNSLSGKAVPKSLAVLAPYGRFLEIGKNDIYQNPHLGPSPFEKNLTYFTIDLNQMACERPNILGKLFDEVLTLLDSEAIQPLPMTSFPVKQTIDAFHYIAQAKHIGKIAIDLSDKNVAILPSAQETARIKADGTYLINGGLGTLGLVMTNWLAEQGAHNLVLVDGESTNLSTEDQTVLDNLHANGVNIKIKQGDISHEDQITAILDEITETMPDLKGIIHTTDVFDEDGSMTQERQDIHAVMTAKTTGAWNLHQRTEELDLDFFILFSSTAALLGSPGQSIYTAANAFLDGLTHYRQSLCLPALSINLGPWTQNNLKTQQEEDKTQGLQPLSPGIVLKIFEYLLEIDSPPQVVAADLDVSAWCQAHPAASRSTMFANLSANTQAFDEAATNNIRMALLSIEPGRPRQALLESFVQEQAAQVLRLSPKRVERHKPLRALGMDSLMTVEFCNRLEASLELTLSATLVWNYPSIAELAPYLAEKMELPLSRKDASPDSSTTTSEISAEIEQMSPDEVEAQLDDELNAIEDLLKGLDS